MNKKLVALAVSAIAAGAASAQTANVTLYGVVDTYVANIRTTAGKNAAGATVAGGTVNALDAGGLSGSRWGLRGSEALGGGLNAVFTLENGFDSSTGGLGQGGRLFGRQAYVGLTGAFGALTVGRQYAPIFYTGADADVDGYSNFSTITNQFLLAAGGALRNDNAINYKTPNMGGLTANLQWAMGEVAGNTSAGRILGANLAYNNGPINAGIGYVDNKNASGVSAQRTWLVGGSYNAGVANIGGEYHEIKNPITGSKWKGWSLGASVPLGAASLVAQFGQLKNGSAKQTAINLGANYTLSKRTDVYARFANADNNANAGVEAAGYGGQSQAGTAAAPIFGADKRIIAAGIRHRF
ncbi:MAG: porin [Burkholderiales bacterium]|nr:porin [Burkholderiales bacterium]